jgi:hypothetical protein
MKQFKSFSEFFNVKKSTPMSLNESLNPYFGIYDYCNDNMETLLDILKKTDLKYEYNPDTNICKIYSINGADAYEVLKSSTEYELEKIYDLDANDCVFIMSNGQGNRAPEGAMM